MRYLAFKSPTDFNSSSWDKKKFLSELAKLIFDVSKIVFDCITSSVVLPRPVSYSTVIPSLAISAALTWDLTDVKALSDDWKLDHALATFVSFVLTASSNNNLFLVVKFEFLLIVDLFFPPE